MNAFVKHHREAIRFDYSCLDRMILAGYLLALQMPGQVASFLRDRRHLAHLSRSYFAGLSRTYREQVDELARREHLEILEPERGQRRQDLVAPYFQQLRQPGMAVILKARETERIAINTHGQHLEMARR
jgi:hypothetical protein